jgi:hypothetical protein
MPRRTTEERERIRELRSQFYALCLEMPAAEAAAIINSGLPPPAFTPAAARNDPADPGSVRIPDDWENLPWPARRSLAAKFSKAPVNSSKDVTAAIEGELARRRAAAEKEAAETEGGE